MAKRSKKKNPMLLSSKDRENIEFNNSLDKQKNLWGKKLNITLGIVIGVVFLCLILLPVFNMSFTRSLSDLGGSTELEEDADFTMVTEMSFLDILTALAGGYEDSIQYIAHNNDSDMSADIADDLFRKFVTSEDIEMLDNAYYVSLFITIAAIIVFVLFVIIVSVYRSKNKDGIMLGISIVLMFAISMIQFLFFAIVGLSAADKGELQPHIGSYFMLFAGTTIFVVYIIYRIKIKKLNNQYRQVPAISQGIVEEK